MAGKYFKKKLTHVYIIGDNNDTDAWKQGPYVNPPKPYEFNKFKLVPDEDMLNDDEINFLKNLIKPFTEEIPENQSPMFYHTGSYDGDVEVQKDAKKILKKLDKLLK